MNMVQKGGASIWKTSRYKAECIKKKKKPTPRKTNAYEANTLV